MRLITVIILFSVVLLAGSFLLFAKSEETTPSASIVSYTAFDKDRPIAEVKKTTFDMGVIKVSDQKETAFTVKNTGAKPLQLFNFTTSCGCTAVQIVYRGRTSEEFSMHSKDDYIAVVAPQTEASVKVIYRPYVMPVYGAVGREAYVSTNDPKNPKLVLSIKAYVQ